MMFRKVFLFFLLGFTACGQAYVPKPTAYPRIHFPDKKYMIYEGSCPFTFRYPQYAKVVRDSSAGADPCWLNVEVPDLKATIHLSYKPVSSFKNLYAMAEDARTFAYKHEVKAEDIFDSTYSFGGRHVGGVLFEIAGNTASSVQFYATDSSRHYLRGALYFTAHPNKDSLAPVIRFMKADIDTLLKSLTWK